METNRLIGADIELMGSDVIYYGGQGNWRQWVEDLNRLPPKGERLDLGDGYWAHRDGISAEFGFTPTCDLRTYLDRVNEGKERVSAYMDTSLTATDTVDVSVPRQCITDIEDYLHMGCEPDYVVSTGGGVNRRSVSPRVAALDIRECSGHIHISLPPPFLESEELLSGFVSELDGVVYPLAFNAEQAMNATWYRKRRVYRPTPYGVEYRSLGAGTMYGVHSDMIIGLVFDIVNNVWRGY